MKRNKVDVVNYMLGFGGVAKGLGSLFGYGLLTFQNAKKRAPIGTNITDKGCVGTKAQIWFNDIAAVDALIKDLVYIRTKMTDYRTAMREAVEEVKGGGFVATIKPLGNPNKLGQVSGAGKKQRMHNSGKNKRSRSSRAGK